MSGDPSRPFKWVTVICSVVTVGFLVAAAVRENISADWRGHQAVFRGILLRPRLKTMPHAQRPAICRSRYARW